MLFGDIYCCWAGSRNLTPHRELTITQAQGAGFCLLFPPQLGGRKLSLFFSWIFPGCPAQRPARWVTPGPERSLERVCGAGHSSLPGHCREVQLCLGHSAMCRPLGTGMKAPVPGLRGGSVAGRARCGRWVLGEPHWPRGRAGGVASGEAI